MNLNSIITNDNDIYIYFKTIEQLKPASILDIGLFLQRIGAISRQTMSCEIPVTTILDGIELSDFSPLPIYHKIYNKILSLSKYNFSDPLVYDIILYLHANELIDLKYQEKIWLYMITHSPVIIADTHNDNFVNYVVSHCRCEALNLDGEQYAIIYGNLSN